MSDLPSGSDSEASGAESQRTFVIFLDDDDDEEEEEEAEVHPLPSYRPKKPLPRKFRGSYHSSVKEQTTQGVKPPFPQVYHTISCTPAMRDKSLEVRVLLSTADKASEASP